MITAIELVSKWGVLIHRERTSRRPSLPPLFLFCLGHPRPRVVAEADVQLKSLAYNVNANNTDTPEL